MVTLVYADTGDWVAVYLDGELVDQGHSFQEDRLLTLLGIEVKTRYDVSAEANGWQFPQRLDSLVDVS